MFGRERPEACQIGKDWKAWATWLQLVVTFDLRVAISKGGVGELDRNERFAREAIDAQAIAVVVISWPTRFGRKSLRMTHW